MNIKQNITRFYLIFEKYKEITLFVVRAVLWVAVLVVSLYFLIELASDVLRVLPFFLSALEEARLDWTTETQLIIFGLTLFLRFYGLKLIIDLFIRVDRWLKE